MRLYLAARYQDRPIMSTWRAAFVAAGHDVTSRWIDGHEHALDHEARDYRDEENRRFAEEDMKDIRACEVLVAFSPREHFGKGRGGRHAEFGYALASGKRLVVVGEREHVFHWLADVVAPEELIQWLAALPGKEKAKR